MKKYLYRNMLTEIGMNEKNVDKIFSRLYKSDLATERRKIKGTPMILPVLVWNFDEAVEYLKARPQAECIDEFLRLVK